MGSPHDALDDLLARGPATWLLAGDSITAGWALDDPRLGYAGRFADHVRHRAGPARAQDAVHVHGVTGAVVGDAVREFEPRIGAYDADVVSVLFGMNDAGAGIAGIDRFADGLDELVSAVRALGAFVVLHTPYPVGAGDGGSHDALPSYVDVIRGRAGSVGALLVDHFAHWQEMDVPAAWYLDPWHLREPGHAELARLMVEVVL